MEGRQDSSVDRFTETTVAGRTMFPLYTACSRDSDYVRCTRLATSFLYMYFYKVLTKSAKLCLLGVNFVIFSLIEICIFFLI